MAVKPKIRPSGVDYEKLGKTMEHKTMEQLMVKDYINFIGSFVRGVFAGLGGVIGASLVVALLIVLLQWLGGIPVVGHYFHNLSTSIHTTK
jgi:hypothetical protein